MPRGHAVVFASGVPPVLIRTVPWMARPYADQIHASRKRHDPSHIKPVVALDGNGDEEDNG